MISSPLPRQSYTIWFTQRTGSTLLSEALSATGIAGKPGEHFLLPDSVSLQSYYQATDYQDLQQRLWKRAGTPNGVVAIKHALTGADFHELAPEICALRELPKTTPFIVLWEDFFPNGKHIFLTRRNKVRQAVSWWKAIQSQVWHQPAGSSFAYEKNLEAAYDSDALRHLLMEINLKEAGMQDFFSETKIAPLTIVYEDFVRNYASTIRQILDFLEIPAHELSIPPPPLQPLADEISGAWVQRFREEIQQDWDKRVW